jgi:hypothetical protein
MTRGTAQLTEYAQPFEAASPRPSVTLRKIEAPYEVAGEAIIYDPELVSRRHLEQALQTRRSRGRRLAFLAPFLAAAAIFSPYGQILPETRDPLPLLVAVRPDDRRELWDEEWEDDDDFWSYAPSLITADQARELDELIGLPVPPELVIRFDDEP